MRKPIFGFLIILILGVTMGSYAWAACPDEPPVAGLDGVLVFCDKYGHQIVSRDATPGKALLDNKLFPGMWCPSGTGRWADDARCETTEPWAPGVDEHKHFVCDVPMEPWPPGSKKKVKLHLRCPRR